MSATDRRSPISFIRVSNNSASRCRHSSRILEVRDVLAIPRGSNVGGQVPGPAGPGAHLQRSSKNGDPRSIALSS